MIACQLLLEITSFLRESHGLYSVSKPTYRPLHRYIVPRRRQSVTSYRRSIVLSPETQQRRLSSLIGGGGERIRRASVLSQASVQTEFNSSPSRTLQEPPTITVSETDPGNTKLEAPDQEGKRERRDSTGQAGNRSSLYFPRQSAQHSPKTAKRIARRSGIGGEGESVRFRSKSTKCDSKHLSVDANVVDDDDESDDEDPTANLPWLSAVIQLNSLTAFLCDHQGVCHLNCHQRQSRSCTRMVQALKTVYSSPNKLDKIPERGLTKVVSSALISAPQIGSAEQVSLKQKDDEEMTKYISSNVSHDIDVLLSVIFWPHHFTSRILWDSQSHPCPWLPNSGLPYLSDKSAHLESGVSWGHLPFGMLKTWQLDHTISYKGYSEWPTHPWPSRQWSFIAQWRVCPCGVWISMGTSSIWDAQNVFFKPDNLT